MNMHKTKLVTISLFMLLSSFVLVAPALAQEDEASKKAELKNEQRPKNGKSKGVPAAKKVPTPKDWVYMYDNKKGYGFYLPAGSIGGSETIKGVNVFIATTPAPAEVAVIVLAYKNKKLTKDDLLDDAVDFLEGMGETVEAGSLTAESDDYALAEATTTDANGKKSRLKILVGTDITDNYVMIVGTDASKFKANEEIIDAIWGSFEMWSGGASGKS
jgi:hypothetical protein